CPSCKADIPEGNRFCEACGAPAPILCPACGEPARSDARFCGKCGAALRNGPFPPPDAAPPRVPPRFEAERRQLTVMFCDLVRSTAWAARLDPEDRRAVIGVSHRRAAAVIEGTGGFVAKYMGDGVLAYFGYPRADEHDAERAVRAGLALVAAVAGLDT